MLPESGWEPDSSGVSCRQCGRSFTLFLRRHHCRRCGLLFCDSCSSQRVLLASPTNPQCGAHGHCVDVAGIEDDAPLAQLAQLAGGRARSTYWRFHEQRACVACVQAVKRLPEAYVDSVALVVARLGSSDAAENAYNVFDYSGAMAGKQRRASSSSVHSCPVCSSDWAMVWARMRRVPGEGWQEAQERHIRECIDQSSAEMQGAPVTMPQPAEASSHSQARSARSPAGVKYIAYTLNADTPLLGQECPICFEDFEPGQQAARLNCLCTYHLSCIRDWLARTPACPVHYE
ncbi:hypothetical protein IWW36_000326 [Coemansia brasiliensis]|uniref:RING-type E3 ubiquitin transferase n=1 Tax=Coemansia brasiliensis TaxID=2650707 RepID=A0A9W8M047_9FUNG|nr:hypothetical protein IWW36_000326 [Coemansia brasiliensis]